MALIKMKIPTTQREVRMFLGIVSYCRQWIPNCSLIAKPLIRLTRSDITDPVCLEGDSLTAFHALRNFLCSAPALGMPCYEKEFFLFVHERGRCSLAVLTQKHGDTMRPLGYYSTVLDNVAAALPGCLKAVAACALAIQQSEGLVMGHTLTVFVPHSVEILLTKSKTQHLLAD